MGIQITSLTVPREVFAGTSVPLQCCVDLQNDMLYSVTWWRENKTFYQYTPPPREKKQAYNDTDLTVDVSINEIAIVQLDTLYFFAVIKYHYIAFMIGIIS